MKHFKKTSVKLLAIVIVVLIVFGRCGHLPGHGNREESNLKEVVENYVSSTLYQMGACCVEKDSIILSNSIIYNTNLTKDSSIIDSSSFQVCHIEKNLEKNELSGPIIKLLMKKLANNFDEAKNNDKNNSTKNTKILN